MPHASVIALMLKESRLFKRRADGKRRIVFLDNVGSHNMTEELSSILEELNVEIRYFPPNATHLVQPCDSFVIKSSNRRALRDGTNEKLEM